MSDVPPRPADGWKMPPPPPIGTDTENDRLRQGQRPATAEDYGPLHDQGPQGPSRSPGKAGELMISWSHNDDPNDFRPQSLAVMAQNIGAAYGVPVIDLSELSAIEAEYEMRAWRTDGVGYREVLYRDRCHEHLVTSLLWDPAW